MVIQELAGGTGKPLYSNVNTLVNGPAVSYRLPIFITDSAMMFPGVAEILTKYVKILCSQKYSAYDISETNSGGGGGGTSKRSTAAVECGRTIL